MPVAMTERQLAFWHELLAPSHDHELSRVPARGSKGIEACPSGLIRGTYGEGGEGRWVEHREIRIPETGRSW